ncbi:transcriptional regulator [Vibrio sp. ABG19]|uniref:winged helix-turn-helix domain-containing protein n=1 Tax=Vibrio sp. ABG19 TaxID=2817385 RepID=UPI00249E262D|nr:transcriptional regulator [Vibrio sp. ABG19]WGY44737.1 transcriptional regulator [Vibrio sp. ABG19]
MMLGTFQTKVSQVKAIINGQLVFKSEINTLTIAGQDYILGENESRLLHFFILNPHRSISRDELYDYVWKARGFEVDDSSLTQAVSTLRKNLRDSARSPKCIRTEPKIGYRFIADVTIVEPDVRSLAEDDAGQPLSEVVAPQMSAQPRVTKPALQNNSGATPPAPECQITLGTAEAATIAANNKVTRLFFLSLITLLLLISTLISMNVNNSRYVLFYLLDLLQ